MKNCKECEKVIASSGKKNSICIRHWMSKSAMKRAKTWR